VFRRAGVTDIFWPHATKNLLDIEGIRIHPFPLYPVRCSTHSLPSTPTPSHARPILYSFQGAYDPSCYISPARTWIFGLPKREDAIICSRSEWHYQQKVYNEQVLGNPSNAAREFQLSREASEYVSTLNQSCFSLCPSGSGPSSIRIYESLGFGSIPVIISDTLRLPGDVSLWTSAALFIPERLDAIESLPTLLTELKQDTAKLLDMQRAGKMLWARYGLNGFIGDIVDLIRDT
jgi:hypothetical protein